MPFQTTSRHYFSKAAAALLLGSLATVGSEVNPIETKVRWAEEAKEYILSREAKEMARNPIMNDIYAYALWRGGMREVDQRVLFDLEYWHLYNDIIARMMYNDSRQTNFRENIDGFSNWLEQQKKAKEEDDRRHSEQISKMIKEKYP